MKKSQFTITYRAEKAPENAIECTYPVGCWMETVDANSWDEAKTIAKTRGEFIHANYVGSATDLVYCH